MRESMDELVAMVGSGELYEAEVTTAYAGGIPEAKTPTRPDRTCRNG